MQYLPSAAIFITCIFGVSGLDSIKYINVGGTGTYNKVTRVNPGVFGKKCPTNPAISCPSKPVTSSGPLAPFNEELTVAFRGPLVLHNIAVFQPSDDTKKWSRTSFYSKKSQTKDNLEFLNNFGGTTTSGEWSQCGGNSQSYADSTGCKGSSTSQVFNGELPPHRELNIMTSERCVDGECGYSRGESFHGWKGSSGGDKVFLIQAQWPTPVASKPSIWMLHADVVRTAQYKCNCRGIGFWGGCGELDIAETLDPTSPFLSSTIYSFQGSIGNDTFTRRPSADGKTTFGIIFSSHSTEDEYGEIKIIHFQDKQPDFNALSAAQVKKWLKDDSTSCIKDLKKVQVPKSS